MTTLLFTATGIIALCVIWHSLRTRRTRQVLATRFTAPPEDTATRIECALTAVLVFVAAMTLVSQ